MAPALLPEAPELLVVAIQLVTLCSFLVALGGVSVARSLVESILGVVAGVIRHVPFIGKLAESKVQAAERKVSDALGHVAASLDVRVGATWHGLGLEIRYLGRTIRRMATLLYHYGIVLPGQAIQQFNRDVARLYHRTTNAVRHEITHLQRLVTGTLPANLRAFEHRAAARMDAIAGTLGHVIEWDIPRLRARDLSLSRLYRALSHRLSRVDKLLGAGAFAAAVAFALSRLGLGALRCSNVGKTAKALCRTNAQWLENLLLGTVAIFGTLSLITFATELYALMGTTVREVAHFWRADISGTPPNPGLGEYGSGSHLGGTQGVAGRNPGLGQIA